MKNVIGITCILVGTMTLAGAVAYIAVSSLGLILLPVCLSALLMAAGVMLFDD